VTAIDATGQMRDHWWFRPGWRVGRRMYTWHVTFEGQTQLHDLVNAYQSALASIPGLDLIPLRWLHLTMQGVAFTDEISETELSGIVAAARKRLANQPPVVLNVGPAFVDPEAIMFDVQPTDALDPVRASIRSAIFDVRGTVAESDQWTAHISLAYSNTDGPATPFANALSRVTDPPAPVTVTAVHLIALSRDTHLYQWTTEAEVLLIGEDRMSS
jgi:2'-5' RNA ligase superfamily